MIINYLVIVIIVIIVIIILNIIIIVFSRFRSWHVGSIELLILVLTIPSQYAGTLEVSIDG